MKAFMGSKNGIFIVLLMVCFFSCSSKKNKAGYKEGHIVYKVNMQQFNSPVSYFCPETFDLIYSKKGFVVKSSFMMGLMELKLFHNYSSSILNMVMDVSGSGQYATYDIKNLSDNISSKNIKDLDCNMDILGHKCKCKEYCNSPNSTEVRVYYSNSFDSKMSKTLLPGFNIEGMILKVEIKNRNGKIDIEAQNFSDEKISTSLFDIPETYKEASMDEIMSIIRDMTK